MIRLDQVGFRYDPATSGADILRDISVEATAGELICVIGANGAGKTTLLKLIAGLLAPTEGRVRCFGLDPAATARREVARKISFLPQSYQLAFPFTASEVVLMGRYAHHGRRLFGIESAADLEAADAAMRRCDIRHLANRRFDQISGGERRRVLLAQAFCQNSPLILLDEPTSSLDPAHAIGFFEALGGELEERGASAVVVTHDLNLAARFADRLWVLAGAELAADGPPAEVLASDAAARAFQIELHVGELPGTSKRFVVPR